VVKQKLYSLQQIAKSLNIPQSTVAYYRNNYADFMPSTRLKGKRYPLYEEQAIEVVRLVRELSEKGKEQHEILIALEAKYPPVIDKSGENDSNEQQTNQQPTTMLATTQNQGEIISRLIGQQTDLIRSQDTTLEAYRNQLGEKERRIEELEAKIDRLIVPTPGKDGGGGVVELKQETTRSTNKKPTTPDKKTVSPRRKAKKKKPSGSAVITAKKPQTTTKKQQKKSFWGRVFS
jgi:DNA-binding transcriptional MerR regulator